jgi:hypothetical protein
VFSPVLVYSCPVLFDTIFHYWGTIQSDFSFGKIQAGLDAPLDFSSLVA